MNDEIRVILFQTVRELLANVVNTPTPRISGSSFPERIPPYRSR